MNTLPSSKVRVSLSALVLLFAGWATAPHAQAQSRAVRINVPFAFESGPQRLPAGIYTLSLQTGHLLQIRGTPQSAFAIVQMAEEFKPAATGKVVFHRYGDRYMLREVWIPNEAVHFQCPKSKAEKELQLAANRPEAKGVEVALLDSSR